MQWLAFLITAVVTVTVQTTLAPALTVGGVRPDFILIAVIFFALHGRGLDAVIAGWALGFAADLQSVQRFGLMALCYAMVAYGVYAIRPYLFRRHPLAQFLVTWISGLLVYGLLLSMTSLEAAIRGGAPGAGWGLAFWVSLYSACFAPIVQRLLLTFSSALGLETPNYTHVRVLRMN